MILHFTAFTSVLFSVRAYPLFKFYPWSSFSSPLFEDPLPPEPQMFSMSQSYTLPLLSNGHAKGVTSLYTVQGEGGMEDNQRVKQDHEQPKNMNNTILSR